MSSPKALSLRGFSNGMWVPWMVVAILGTSVVANVYLLVRATSDPSFAVEPDYYVKAVQWDRIQAEQEASLRLGWKADLRTTKEGAVLYLVDGEERPIEGASVRAHAFAKARAQRFVDAAFEDLGGGYYAWNYPFERSGRWEFRLVATRGEDQFVSKIEEDVP